jgi:hypothetical protein
VSESPDEQLTPSCDVGPGDVVELRKAHPCGGTEWMVTRIGADVGLRCLRCDRTMMLPRHEFRTKVRRILRSNQS